ncbi:MAG: c-type cytochrome [Edaphobacter sp.]
MRRGFGLSLLLIVAVLAGIGAIVIRDVLLRGFSARTPPAKVEVALAATVRRHAIPARYQHMQNPVVSSPEVLHAAEAHWADHCATCHANNGSGETMFGRTMYPRPPDMRLGQTQSQSDGELYYTIQNGVPLSGMPAFGDPGDSDMDTWRLVTFIRHLPQLTSAEELEMEDLNPKSPDEMQEDQEEQNFLNGTPAQPKRNTTGKEPIR